MRECLAADCPNALQRWESPGGDFEEYGCQPLAFVLVAPRLGGEMSALLFQYFLGLGGINDTSTGSNSNLGSSASGANVALWLQRILASRSGKSGFVVRTADSSRTAAPCAITRESCSML